MKKHNETKALIHGMTPSEYNRDIRQAVKLANRDLPGPKAVEFFTSRNPSITDGVGLRWKILFDMLYELTLEQKPMGSEVYLLQARANAFYQTLV